MIVYCVVAWTIFFPSHSSICTSYLMPSRLRTFFLSSLAPSLPPHLESSFLLCPSFLLYFYQLFKGRTICSNLVLDIACSSYFYFWLLVNSFNIKMTYSEKQPLLEHTKRLLMIMKFQSDHSTFPFSKTHYPYSTPLILSKTV